MQSGHFTPRTVTWVFTMKSFQVVIVAILFMALLITSDAGKGKGKCKKQIKNLKQKLGHLETKLQQVEELNNELQNETAELKKNFDECQNYQTLSEGDRKNTYLLQLTVEGTAGCDNNLRGWFRFQGDAGTKMAIYCVKFGCGTGAPGWLTGAHPTVDEGRVTRRVCFTTNTNCCLWDTIVQVRNCGDFYVYNIFGTPPQQQCMLRYCSSD
ncbi:pancreatic secretory granule membrane major glycoprotein GP2-like isoform X2 [Acropora millepora]|uniref:pancreatic secretory granule membrane major glycoprotein GP2-like isoform X2 n=1 Tax=Acropora millepora TaxID=45264 RepID=UPI001CF46D21|nr:pancreatic secretory granule membrane major glycoprotein GP2-like isoform X2 [Acropora millepora]